MNIDLTNVPWSRFGSYMAVSRRTTSGSDPALYLRTVHGDRESDLVFRLDLIVDGELVSYETDVTPAVLRLTTANGNVRLVFSEERTLLLRGEGQVGLRLALASTANYGYTMPFDGHSYLVNAWKNRMLYRVTPHIGDLTVDAPFRVMRSDHAILDLTPDANGIFEATVAEAIPEPLWVSDDAPDFEETAKFVSDDWERFRLAIAGGVVPARQETANLMAYVLWSATVAPSGHLKRPAMYMSKNHMTNVWTWDHCFNALALAKFRPALAEAQFWIPFDHQATTGMLPDCMNDKTIIWNFTKPPIHGWTLRLLLETNPSYFGDTKRLDEIYGPLALWTDWWLKYRDSDRDGLPQYHHGNDSGWDNSTSFDIGYPIEGPDLAAYLVIQMDTLADIAERLGRTAEVDARRKQADELLEKLLAHSWRGDRFVAPHSGDHAIATEGDSLYPFLPLVLGPRLPAEIFQTLLNGLMEPGRFLTDFGLATESVRSPLYQPDGYWRGPIWSPPIHLITDGLRRAGASDEAREIETRFMRAVETSGAAENFNALTGEGLRDRAYTWTAATYLALVQNEANFEPKKS